MCQNSIPLQAIMQGQRLRGDRPPQKVRWRDGGAFIPQYLENVWQIYTAKTNKNERERR